MLNHRIGPYKLIREITNDKLGQVFEAIDLSSRKAVVIKSLRPEAAKQPEIVSRLYSEAKTLALLNHPNIARIFGFIRREEQLYLVMEFIEGDSLRSLLQKKKRLDPPLALGLIRQVLAAVAFGHELGVIHGDLRPSNVMVSNFGQIKVLEFAIATILGNFAPTGSRTGTTTYLSPEQIRHDPVDVRTDTFALGVLLYECLTGRAPFNRDPQTPRALESTPLPPSVFAADCPPWLDAFMMRALAPSPADRFQSVAAVSQALEPPFEVKNNARSTRLSIDPSAITRQSLAGAIGTRSEFLRKHLASATVAIQSGMKNFHSFACSHLDVAKITAWRRGVASALERVSSNTHRGSTVVANETIRHKNAPRRGLASITPPAWAQSSVVRIKNGTRAFRAAAMDGARSLGSRKGDGAALSEGWQRSFAIILLLASVSIEMFIFGGTDTLVRHDDNTLAVLSQNGAAESFLEPFDSPVAAAPARAPAPKPAAKAVKRIHVEPKKSAQPAQPKISAPPTEVEPSHYEARIARRTVTYRPAWRDFPKIVLPERKPVPPVPSRRTVEKHTAKNQPDTKRNQSDANTDQLDVKWEN